MIICICIFGFNGIIQSFKHYKHPKFRLFFVINSKFRLFKSPFPNKDLLHQMNPSNDQLSEYAHYLQGQVQKFTAFMLTQKMLNEKHLFVENNLNQIFQNLQKMESKIKVIEINEKDTLLEIRKIRAEKQAVKMMELRLENIQRELSSVLKLDSSHSLDHNQSLQQQQSSINQHQKHHHRTSPPKSQHHQSKDFGKRFSEKQKDLLQIENYLSDVFISHHEVQTLIIKSREDLDLRIKKLQIEIDKSKQSFLKLTNHINSLSLSNNIESSNFKKQPKQQQNRIVTESTKDLHLDPSVNQHQNAVTKKQLKRMQKKLENFFSQKLSQITTKAQQLRSQNQTESLSSDKAIKFRKIQQKYDRLTFQHTSPKQTRSQRKINISDNHQYQQIKPYLFENDFLRQKKLTEVKNNKTKNRKSVQRNKSVKDSPITMLESPKHLKQQRNGVPSKSASKKIRKNRSPQRLKKVNIDYMMQ